jgi:hypothetical protein
LVGSLIMQKILATLEHLKGQPMVLALVLINIIFLIAITFILREVSQSIERRDAIIERCLQELK